MAEWTDYAVEKPTEAGIYAWRVPSTAVPGIHVLVAEEMRMRGAGYSNVLSVGFDYWDGYRLHVPAGTQWRRTEETKARLLGIEGLEHAPCIYCCKVPTLHAACRSSGGWAIRPRPNELNTWCLECCDWGKTPHLRDPRELEHIRRGAIARAGAAMLEALRGVESRCAASGYVGQDGQFLKVVRAAIAKATGSAS